MHLKFIYSEKRPQNFAKSSPWFCPMLCQSKERWRICQILWPSQNIWTLIECYWPWIPSDTSRQIEWLVASWAWQLRHWHPLALHRHDRANIWPCIFHFWAHKQGFIKWILLILSRKVDSTYMPSQRLLCRDEWIPPFSDIRILGYHGLWIFGYLDTMDSWISWILG